ncbi:DUF2512 family protein [Lihuaxuella thermophila]|uniref:4 TMS phage holin, superfamily IV n=1 Tax=Lihuaxuella thermophila TaxID=1173111 RepID=A0A1H8D0A3_9BACL|nr:DUF2512 family protein [Lihuaxuella thermophila]SEN00589.1 Protein of unknown function [Lihuaxuella thermophila]
MAGFIIKLIVCPVVVLLSSFLFREVYYPSFYHPVIVGIVLAIAAHAMEIVFLRRGTFWLSNLMDFIAATAIVYISSYFFPGSRVTWVGATLTAFLLAVTEYFQHLWLLRTGKTDKGA